MERKKLGNTDLELTRIGLGTWAIGGGDWKFGWGDQVESEAIEAIVEAIDHGINWIDTAAVYGGGVSEAIVGKALQVLGPERRPIVATKCGRVMRDPETIDKVLKRDSIIAECEASLQRLAEWRPSAIIHLAAASNPNWCELHPVESQVINTEAPVYLAAYCRDAGIPFIFTSTDLVFDGQQAPYVESWAPAPICTYGRQKAQAEQALLLAYPEAVIARLPIRRAVAKTRGEYFTTNGSKLAVSPASTASRRAAGAVNSSS